MRRRRELLARFPAPSRRGTRALLAASSILATVVLVQVPGAPRAFAEPGWRWPLPDEPTVGRGFAPPASRYGSGHRGADLAGTAGEPVLAAAGGVVSHSGQLAGRGVVVVTHGALRTTYEPVTGSVPVGTNVAAGAVIGRLEAGHQGCQAAACLHWGLRRGEDYLDPVGLVDGGPARLLPLGPPGARVSQGAGGATGGHDLPIASDGPGRLRPPAVRSTLTGPLVVGAGVLTAGWLSLGRGRPR